MIPRFAVLFPLLLSSLCGAAPNEKKSYPAEEIAAESKRVNEFLDKAFDEYIGRHPQLASSLGIKTNYDKWEDLSDAADVADLAISLQNLASLKRDLNYDALDAQTQLS